MSRARIHLQHLVKKRVALFLALSFTYTGTVNVSHAADKCSKGHFGLRGLIYQFNDETMRGHVFANAVEAGVKWCQTIARWQKIEPNRPRNGVHHYEWALLDDFVKTAFNHGICVNIIFKSYSKWGAKKSGIVSSETKKGGQIFQSAPPDRSHLSDWRAFVKAVVERYDGDGKGQEPSFVTSKNNVKYWHIESEPGGHYPAKWNKKPGSIFWYGRPDEYAEHFVETVGVIKGADKGAKVVLGGFVSKSVLDDPKKSYVFQVLEAVRRIEKRTGIPYFDIFDCHHFRNISLIDEVGKGVDDILKANGFWGKRKWVTQTTLGSRVLNRTFQGEILRREYLRYMSRDLVKRYVSFFANGFEKVFYVKLVDSGSDSEGEVFSKFRRRLFRKRPFYKYYGLIDSGLKRKPLYYTYKLSAEKLDFFTSVAEVKTTCANLKCYEFTFDEKDSVYVAWSLVEQTSYCNLQTYFGKKNIKITQIVEHEGKSIPDVRVVSSSSVPVSLSPVFLEN
ncbi:MAG: hypothetical protein SV375_20190 [Thermodesulfobacteriota bacterium]|nr:hypothetical protein [Thermodesulfobacteriota bacterium]